MADAIPQPGHERLCQAFKEAGTFHTEITVEKKKKYQKKKRNGEMHHAGAGHSSSHLL